MSITFDTEIEYAFENETASRKIQKFITRVTGANLKKDGLYDVCSDGLPPTRSLEDSLTGECRWPYPELFICGRVQDGKSIYCEVHHARAIQKTQPSRIEP